MSFSRPKRLLFPRVYGKSEAVLHCGKKSKKGVKGINSGRDVLPMRGGHPIVGSGCGVRDGIGSNPAARLWNNDETS